MAVAPLSWQGVSIVNMSCKALCTEFTQCLPTGQPESVLQDVERKSMSITKAPNARRVKVFSKTNGKCYYCGSTICLETFHIDHMHPTSRGGVNLQENLAPACPHCNVSKGQKTVEEWRLVMSFRVTHCDAPDMSLKQIQWLTDCGYVYVPHHEFFFEANK